MYGSGRVTRATKEQRENYKFIGPGIGIHWEDLDEDLSVEGMVLGGKVRTSKPAN
ncbi:MAG: DUF2442 domain-containing protein [Blastocatellia bacterium]